MTNFATRSESFTSGWLEAGSTFERPGNSLLSTP